MEHPLFDPQHAASYRGGAPHRYSGPPPAGQCNGGLPSRAATLAGTECYRQTTTTQSAEDVPGWVIEGDAGLSVAWPEDR